MPLVLIPAAFPRPRFLSRYRRAAAGVVLGVSLLCPTAAALAASAATDRAERRCADTSAGSPAALLRSVHAAGALPVAEATHRLSALIRATVSFDLVLMDVQMPVMDGLDARAALRARETGCHSIPVIAMTTQATVGDRERYLAAGIDDYLAKPINVNALYDVLARTAGPCESMDAEQPLRDGTDG